jgi:hypothetical protein
MQKDKRTRRQEPRQSRVEAARCPEGPDGKKSHTKYHETTETPETTGDPEKGVNNSTNIFLTTLVM